MGIKKWWNNQQRRIKSKNMMTWEYLDKKARYKAKKKYPNNFSKQAYEYQRLSKKYKTYNYFVGKGFRW